MTPSPYLKAISTSQLKKYQSFMRLGLHCHEPFQKVPYQKSFKRVEFSCSNSTFVIQPWAEVLLDLGQEISSLFFPIVTFFLFLSEKKTDLDQPYFCRVSKRTKYLLGKQTRNASRKNCGTTLLHFLHSWFMRG